MICRGPRGLSRKRRIQQAPTELQCLNVILNLVSSTTTSHRLCCWINTRIITSKYVPLIDMLHSAATPANEKSRTTIVIGRSSNFDFDFAQRIDERGGTAVVPWQMKIKAFG